MNFMYQINKEIDYKINEISSLTDTTINDSLESIESITDSLGTENILQNKYISKKVKFEFLVIKYLGVGFHLFIFPFYKFMRQILRNITNENNL